MTGRTLDGRPLTPGVNVDPVDITAGLHKAVQLGYDDPQAEMVVVYALQRWKRGEEAGAERTWVSHYRHDFTSWRVILSAAQAAGDKAFRDAR